MSDGTRVKLTLPSWHAPYLEKYKIMELFHELTRELIIQQPVDHLMFVKQLLYRASKNIGVSRVIILGSPRVNCMEVAKQIAQETNHQIITDANVLGHLNVPARDQVRPGALASCLAYLIHTQAAQNRGWILADCVKTPDEAKKMLLLGVIPTHVLHLIPPFTPNLTDLLYCNVHESWPEYRRNIMHIRDVFKDKVLEIHLKQRLMHEVVTECVTLLKNMKRLGCPKQVRAVILGPRGSGRKTQAKLIAQKLNLVHIDFHYLLCQVWNAKGELTDALRTAEREVCFRPDLLSQVINRRILEEDCLRKGWILTGYPFNVADFKYLDTLDTPPNRVIFLECDLNICTDRVACRRINAYTGELKNINKLEEADDVSELKIHPKDSAGIVEAEITYYCEQYGAMRNYCGETGYVINADQPERWVYESILAAIVRENLSAPPRNPCILEDKPSTSSISQASDSSSTDNTLTQLISCYTRQQIMSEEFIPTRGSMKKKNEEVKFDVIIHRSYKPKQKKIETRDHLQTFNNSTITTNSNEIDMKKARYEIIKFGMSGFNTRKKEEAKVQLAIKLGAKPRRNEYKNYKQVIKERRKEKIREEKRKLAQQLGKTQLIRATSSKKNFDKKRKKDKNILEVYGKVKVPNSI